jgi:alkane 1-monooxygenase
MANNFLYSFKFMIFPLLSFFILIVINPYESFKGIFSFGVLFLVYGLGPLLDLVFPPSVINPSTKIEEEELSKKKIFDVMLWIVLPIQLTSVIYYLINFHNKFETESILTLVGWTVSTGIFCGIFGINTGHELAHRTNSWQRFVGKALLLTTLRMSFYIEHNWGHHTNVSTDEDPASAKKNEIVYLFIPKSIFKTWLNSWSIQKSLLKKRKASFFSVYNDLLWYTLIQWGIIIMITIVFDWKTTLGFVAISFVGMIILELGNYIEHYGLRRDKENNGKYERVLPVHSWNSNHSISGSILFYVSRHSDHHYISSRPYQILRNYDSVPNLPMGYAGMMALALIPPLWFYIMNKKVDEVLALNKKGFTPVTMNTDLYANKN